MVKRIPKNAWLETDPDGRQYWVWEKPLRPIEQALKMLARWEKKSRPKCGAKTKHFGGRPCQAKALPKTGRCKWHGGLSTGAKTPEGKERCRQAVLRRWERWRFNAKVNMS